MTSRLHRAPERAKCLTACCPVCGAPMPLTYDGTSGHGWERSSDLPDKCPRGHALSLAVRDAIEDIFDERARLGDGDDDRECDDE